MEAARLESVSTRKRAEILRQLIRQAFPDRGTGRGRKRQLTGRKDVRSEVRLGVEWTAISAIAAVRMVQNSNRLCCCRALTTNHSV